MTAREQWQALQSRLVGARAALERGDRDGALAEVTAALELDPNFLAAHSLRDRILSGDIIAAAAAPAAPQPAGAPVAAQQAEAPPQPAERPLVSQEGYARFEQRARRRRVDRRIEAARTAIERKRLKQAAAALDEVIELDPNLPELSELTAQFDLLRRSMLATRRGPWLAAGAVFVGTVFCASWLQQDSSPLFSRPMIATAPLFAAPTVTISPDMLTAGTTGTADTLPNVADAPGIVHAAAATPAPAPVEEARIAPPVAIVRPPAEPPAEPLRAPLAVTMPVPPPPIVPPARPLQESTVGEVVAAMAPRAIAAPAPVPSRVEAVDDRALVQQTLQRYRSAYEGLDAQSAHAVWPAVNQVALARAFNGLESQSLTFDACDVRVRGEAATATCQGSARYVPKVGNREPRIEPRVWNFTLRKSGADWKIDSARADR